VFVAPAAIELANRVKHEYIDPFPNVPSLVPRCSGRLEILQYPKLYFLPLQSFQLRQTSKSHQKLRAKRASRTGFALVTRG
jgi:hypothetical protein